MISPFRSVSTALVLVAASLLPTVAVAQSGIWVTNTAGTYNWSQAGNWLNDVIADGADNVADFNTAGLTGPMTVNLDSSRTIGSLVFDNPSNQFGWTVSGSNTLTLATSSAGGAIIAVNNPQITATLAIPLAGTQGITTTGQGTLVLSGINSYSGGTNVLNGTVQVAADAALGTGNVTGVSLASVNFTGTTTTAKSFAMNGGTVSVAGGQTVSLNGSVVTNAFLDGGGTFATSSTLGAQFVNVTATQSVTITSNNAADQFVHFTNSGKLNIAEGVGSDGTSPIGVTLNGFTNQGTGSLTIDTPTSPNPSQTGAFVNVTNFQSYGTLTINTATIGTNQIALLTNVGSSPLAFNAGSRTYVGNPANEGPLNNPSFVAGVDLQGKNLVVTEGLFANNGFVTDRSSGTLGSIIVDYGALYRGTGFTGVNVITQNGGKVQAGNSPGAASFGNFVFGPGGVNNYVFNINDATGTPGAAPSGNGPSSGWGLVKAVRRSVLGSPSSPGDFVWTATTANKLTVALDTIVSSPDVDSDALAPMANFDPTKFYTWPAVEWAGTYSGPTNAAMLDATTSFDTSGFLNPIAGTFGWSLDLQDQTLSLTCASAVPEPGTLALVSVAVLGMYCRKHIRSRARKLRNAASTIDPRDPHFGFRRPSRFGSGFWKTEL